MTFPPSIRKPRSASATRHRNPYPCWSAFVSLQEAIQLSNLDAVRRMGLKPGDIVERSQETEFEFKINGVRKPRKGEEAVVIAPGRIERQSG